MSLAMTAAFDYFESAIQSAQTARGAHTGSVVVHKNERIERQLQYSLEKHDLFFGRLLPQRR